MKSRIENAGVEWMRRGRRRGVAGLKSQIQNAREEWIGRWKCRKEAGLKSQLENAGEDGDAEREMDGARRIEIAD